MAPARPALATSLGAQPRTAPPTPPLRPARRARAAQTRSRPKPLRRHRPAPPTACLRRRLLTSRSRADRTGPPLKKTPAAAGSPPRAACPRGSRCSSGTSARRRRRAAPRLPPGTQSLSHCYGHTASTAPSSAQRTLHTRLTVYGRAERAPPVLLVVQSGTLVAAPTRRSSVR